MKKIMLSITMCILMSCFAQAQDKVSLYDFTIGGTLMYAKPLGDFSEYAKGGIGYTGMVGYKINEQLTAGIEVSSAATLSLGGPSLVDLYGLQSAVAKGWYKFGEKSLQPFVGLGVGVASFEEPDLIITTTDVDGEVNETTIEGTKRFGLGANAEVGIALKGFLLSYSFAVGGKSSKEPTYNQAVADLGITYHRFNIGYAWNF